MNKKFISIVICMLLTFVNFYVYSQNEVKNLEKYWNYRDRFRKWFTKIGPDFGESLPASIKNTKDCAFDNGTEQLHFGDVGAYLGDYIGVLSTEYKLLKQSQMDLNGIRSELYYALTAINRLDNHAERYFDLTHVPILDPNGFFIRDDIRPSFSNNWSDNFNQTSNCRDDVNCVACDYFRYVQNGGGAIDNTYSGINNEESQDQLIGLLLGLTHVVQLVDNDWVKPTPNDPGFNLVDEARNMK